SKSKKNIFLGYCKNSKGYRLFDPTLEKIVVSRDVIVDESSVFQTALADTSFDSNEVILQPKPFLVPYLLHCLKCCGPSGPDFGPSNFYSIKKIQNLVTTR